MAAGEKSSATTLRMGPGTYEVPLRLFSLNRERLVSALTKDLTTPPKSYVLLQGGKIENSENEATANHIFRQDSFFMWAFGVLEPGCYGLISLETDRACLYVPRSSQEYEVWMGPFQSLENYKTKYGIKFIHYVDEIADTLKTYVGDDGVLLLLQGVNSNSGLPVNETYFHRMEEFNLNYKVLFPVITELRVYKTDLEKDVIRYVVEISSEAHKLVMQTLKPGYSEYQAESLFLDYCYRLGGCRHVSYPSNCSSGINSAILKYGHAGAPNNQVVQNGDMCLFDMGANYFGYSAKISCSFPANGIFTEDQKLIYNAVLAVRKVVYKSAKPGISWVGLHLYAARKLLAELKNGGLLKGSLDHMIAAGLHYIFQPHGLGHLIGLDVTDVGGCSEDQHMKPPSVASEYLKLRRVLQPRMYITVGPGCYFIKPLLDKAKSDPSLSRFLVRENLDRFESFGGIRIEDNAIVTETGLENLTRVPRTVEDIEEWISRRL